MDYQTFEELLKSELPLNRKERFYSGTVLPSFLFHNGFANLFEFLHQIKGFPKEINQETTGDNFLFYTEYGFKESADVKLFGREIKTETRETPDAIIEILQPQKALVIIEVKMFWVILQDELDKQIKEQKRNVSDILKRTCKLNDNQIFYVALIPAQLGFKESSAYTIINWQYFVDNPKLNLQSNHFYNYLNCALKHYEGLKQKFGPPLTVKGKRTGEELYNDGKNEKKLWVGCEGGKEQIIKDVRKNDWKEKHYFFNTEKPAAGKKGNWINSEDFAKIVDENKTNS